MNKNFAALSLSALSVSLIFSGCSSKAEVKDEPASEVCLYKSNSSNTEYVAMVKFTVDGNELTGDYTIFYPNMYEGQDDDKLRELFKIDGEIVRKDGVVRFKVKPVTTDISDERSATKGTNQDYIDESITSLNNDSSGKYACGPEHTEDEAIKMVQYIVAQNVYKDVLNEEENNSKSDTKDSKTSNEEPVNGIRPSFQKSMDEYVKFFQDYANFMSKYAESDDTTAMMNDYLKFIQQYTTMMEAMNAVDQSSLSPEESNLYLETMTKVNEILLSVS